MMTTDSPSPKPTRRRWLQFSLRTLMLLCLVAAIPLGYVAWRRHLGQRQAEIATELEAAGYFVYGFKVPGVKLAQVGPIIHFHQYESQNDPLWCWGHGPAIFGDAPFRSVSYVAGRGRDDDFDREWSLIGELSKLRVLDLSRQRSRFFHSKQAIPTLNKLKKLERLVVPDDLDPEQLDGYLPPNSLMCLGIDRSSQSAARWRAYYVNGSTIEPHIIMQDKPE